MQGCVKNKPVQNRLHSPLKVHLFVNFGIQQDNQSLTQKHYENKFDLGSAPSKRRTKRTNKPINYNTECTTKLFIVFFFACKTQQMILHPPLSPPTRQLPVYTSWTSASNSTWLAPGKRMVTKLSSTSESKVVKKLLTEAKTILCTCTLLLVLVTPSPTNSTPNRSLTPLACNKHFITDFNTLDFCKENLQKDLEL